MKRLVMLISCVSLLAPGRFLLASHSTDISVSSLDGGISFLLGGTNPVSGASIALADLGKDGVAEVIVGNGMGLEPRVRVLRQDGSEIGSFLAFAPTLGVGVNVVSCDLTGDGMNEIIVAPQRGGGPHIRVFNAYGKPIDGGGFFAYDGVLRTGVNLACGDLLGDGAEELVTLPAAGGGPHVRVWSWNEEEELIGNFFALHKDDRSGLVGVVHNRTLIVAQQFTSTPTIKSIVIHTSPTTISEEKISIDGRGVESLAVVNDEWYLTTSSTATLYNLTNDSTRTLDQTHVVLASFGDQLLFVPGRFLFDDTREEQRIEVDVSQQRLYAFEYGILRNSFLISSGLNNATPIGVHTLLAKVPLVNYAWSYGEGNPNNYDLGWVPYNLRFYPHVYIHYAPWHNNFGHQMSRGCVNVNDHNSRWLYAWATVGTPIEIQM
jgi:hypothetical protein